MTSNEKLTLVQTIETTDKHDFVSPQVSVDATQQRHKQKMEAAQAYILQQAFPNVQTLTPLFNSKAPSYTIRLDTVGSFLNPQPHMCITQDPETLQAAEVKLQVRGYDSTIIYTDAGTSQKITLQNPHEPSFECLIKGKSHWWHPLGPSTSVFELTEEAEKRVALFVYAEGMAQGTGPRSGTLMLAEGQKIGEVHFMEDFLQELGTLQQILFSAVVVLEQVKRRATSLAAWVTPASSFPGRRRSRQKSAETGV